MTTRFLPIKERFELHIIPVTESGCWIWDGAINSGGYGFIGVNGHILAAHRVSWTIYNGEIPNRMNVLHRCDTRCCVNPHHLFLGTAADNNRDCYKKGRDNKRNRSVTVAIALDILLFSKSHTDEETIKRYSISKGALYRLKMGTHWICKSHSCITKE